MKTRDIILGSVIFALCIGITADIVTYQLTGSHLYSVFARSEPAAQPATRHTCTSMAAPVRPHTTDPQLAALAEYEQACRSAFADDMMIFTTMPISSQQAAQQADAMAARLREFAAWHVTPLVVMEPSSSHGLVSLKDYADGVYDAWITAYFTRLQRDGITDSQLGIWIPFPEPQQTTWRDSTPDNFAHSVNRFFTVQRQLFPQARTAILLDSQVGSPGASQLLAWTRLIDNSLVDIAGLQGFPWYPLDSGDPRQPVTKASQFVPATALEQIASSLGTHHVLINTGTFRHKLRDDGSELTIPNAKRQASIDSIIHEASALRHDRYTVTVNIFAQNKLHDSEHTDWSYWQQGDYDLSTSTPMFTDFVYRLKRDHISVSLFDARPQN